MKKSSLKKKFPFNLFFHFRDKKNYQSILNKISADAVVLDYNEHEKIVKLNKNGKELQLIVRNFPSSDLAVLHQVFYNDCYYPLIKKMNELTGSDGNVKILDAGANVGFSLLYFKTFFPSAEIVGIEPARRNILQIEKNLSTNRICIKQLIEGALWSKSAYLKVVSDFRDNTEAALTVEEVNHVTDIQGYDLKEIFQKCSWQEADLIKIDIEGGERHLFDTVEKADAILERTKFLAIEIHDEFDIRETIYGHLKRNNFEFFNYDDLTLAVNQKFVKTV
jgi:FkbM family methyltransferase